MSREQKAEQQRAIIYAAELQKRFDNGLLPELQTLRQWVVWKPALTSGKLKKVPFNPNTHRYASVNEPASWGRLDSALSALTTGNYRGLGIMLTADDPICGIDIDHSHDPQTGKLTPLAQEIIALLSSYTETSPSKTGIHILTKAALPGRGIHTEVEMYDRGRFFTVTTNRLAGTHTNITQRQQEVTSLYARFTPVLPPNGRRESTRVGDTVVPRSGASPNVTSQAVTIETNTEGTGPHRSDQEVLERAFSAKNGDNFRRLWEGDYSAYVTAGQPDKSRADWQLVRYLLYWTNNDPIQTDRLFRQSGLFDEKWDRKTGDYAYGSMTIHNAMK